MLSLASAKRLAAAGILWDPKPGDRFAIDREQLDGETFWISELTIEVHHHHDQTVLGFNGTTEWALDSVALSDAVWLPREDQLRELLGDRLDTLQRLPTGWELRWRVDGDARRVRSADVEEAYAAALLDISPPD